MAAEQHLPLVSALAGRLARRVPSVDRDDLVGAGAVGLMEALRRFDASRGASFAAYATPYIRGEMRRWISADRGLPRRTEEERQQIERASSRLRVALGREPSDAELAEEMHVTQRRVRSIKRKVWSLTGSRLDDDDGRGGVADADASSPEDVAARRHDVEVLAHLASLNEGERAALSLRYGGDLSDDQIGRRLGVTAECVRLRRQRALGRMRAAARSNHEEKQGA